MVMTNKMMEDDQGRQPYAASLIGRNCISQSTFWVMSEEVQVKSDGQFAQSEDTPFMWLRRLVNGNNILLQESLACKITTPFDDGHNISYLCLDIFSDSCPRISYLLWQQSVRVSWEPTT